MSDLKVNAELIGRKVAIPSRPEWGHGTVLRVQSTVVNGEPRHRVSVQFVTGHRTLQVPPARLIEPPPEPERAAGWLDTIGRQAPDDRLVSLPPAITEFLGTHAQRMAALAPLFKYTEDAPSLVRWARRQANVADPLSLWTRDELLMAFRTFCMERDSTLRVSAARLKQAEGAEALTKALNALPHAVSTAMRTALQRPI